MHRLLLLPLLPALLFAQTAVEITAEPHHHLVFTNHQVRVFDVEVPPNAATLMHWHRHDYIYVTLGATELSNEVEGKPPVTLKLADGETRFSPGPFAHLVRVSPAQPFRNVTIELLQDAKLRHSPAHSDPKHPDADRGLNMLDGGTQEILFVKDGVRASEFELQPRATAPLPPHAFLLVAVTNLDLQAAAPHTDSHHAAHYHQKSTQLKSGDVEWFPANHSRALTNTSHPARFVTLEFR